MSQTVLSFWQTLRQAHGFRFDLKIHYERRLFFAYLHDIPNIHTKFDDSQSGTFGDHLSKQIDTDRQIDGNGRPLISYSWGHETLRKHEGGNSPDGLDYYTWFTLRK